jgi:hypothetical protein
MLATVSLRSSEEADASCCIQYWKSIVTHVNKENEYICE